MNELNIKLSPKKILNKEFNYEAKGYSPKEVDEYLDGIIADYNEFNRLIKKMESESQELKDENNHLKNELRKLKIEFETFMESSGTGKFTSNNIDILRRLSNLEKIVYGKDEE